MKKIAVSAKFPDSNANGFATKADLRKLEGKMDHRFEQVDKRFEQVDKRFEQVDKRFEQVDKRFEQVDKRFEQVDKRFEQIDKKLGKIDMRLGIFHFEWDAWKQDALTDFNSRWITRIDPILAEIETHRQKEVLWAEQAKTRENKWLSELKEMRVESKSREERWMLELSQTRELVTKIAKKIGV